MSRRYHSNLPAGQPQIILEGPEFHHLSHVGRLRQGETVILFDGQGYEAEGTIDRLTKREAFITVGNRKFSPGVIPVHLTIATALPKGDREMFLVEKLTELGVSEIVPLSTKRSVVHPKDASQRLERYAIEACKQSGRNQLPKIWDLTTLGEFFSSCQALDKRILHPYAEASSAVQGVASPLPASMALLIGPEGGFDLAEVKQAIDLGWKPWILPGNILRIETAAIAVASIIRGLCP